MVASLSVTLRRHNKHRLPRSKFNEIVRETMIEDVGPYWLVTFLPKHFEPGNTQRYRLPERSAKYKSWRSKHRFFFDKKTGHLYVIVPNPIALLLTGRSRDLANRPPSSFTIRATATYNRVVLRIRVPLGHAYQSRAVSKQVVMLIASEIRTLRRIAKEGVIRRVNAADSITTVQLTA